MKKSPLQARGFLSIVILAVTILLSVAVCLALPGTINVQWSFDGVATNTMTSCKAALSALGACVLCLLVWHMLAVRFAAAMRACRPLRVLVTAFGVVFSCAGIAMNIAFLVLN